MRVTDACRRDPEQARKLIETNDLPAPLSIIRARRNFMWHRHGGNQTRENGPARVTQLDNQGYATKRTHSQKCSRSKEPAFDSSHETLRWFGAFANSVITLSTSA